MTKLLLALDIAEVIAKATNDPGVLNIDEEAAALLAAHPEACSSYQEVAEALIAEGADAGVIPPKPSAF